MKFTRAIKVISFLILISFSQLSYPFETHPSHQALTNLAWSHQNQEAINHFLACNHQGIAVFDADGTLWADDVGEAFFRWLIITRKFPHAAGKNLYRHYQHKLSKNKEEAYAWVTAVMAGIPEREVKLLAAEFFRRYFVQRIYPTQKQLIAQLQRNGIQVWIISASNRWIVQAGARYLGVPPDHVIAIDLIVKNGILTAQVKYPIPFRAGKVRALHKMMTQRPLLASSDSQDDQPLLDDAKCIKIFLIHKTPNKDNNYQLAKRKNWNIQFFPLLQPAFPLRQ